MKICEPSPVPRMPNFLRNPTQKLPEIKVNSDQSDPSACARTTKLPAPMPAAIQRAGSGRRWIKNVLSCLPRRLPTTQTRQLADRALVNAHVQSEVSWREA